MNFGGKTQYGMTKTTPVTVIRQSPERKDLQSLLARESMRKKWISPKTENEALKWDVRFSLKLTLTWAHVLKICKTITWHKLVFCSYTTPIPPSSGKVADSADLGFLCVHPSPRSLGKDCAAPAGVWTGSSSPLHRETAPYSFSPKCRVWGFLQHWISILAAPSRNPSPPCLPIRMIPIGIAFKYHKILHT